MRSSGVQSNLTFSEGSAHPLISYKSVCDGGIGLDWFVDIISFLYFLDIKMHFYTFLQVCEYSLTGMFKSIMCV